MTKEYKVEKVPAWFAEDMDDAVEWELYIWLDNKWDHLGNFDTEEDARNYAARYTKFHKVETFSA